jgi:2-iminobutanoate/2-iminopropanoate deaminase
METKKVIIAKNAPAAVGAYSHANVINGIVYTAGQIALDPITNTMVTENITIEATRVMENLKAILEESGSSMEKVLKATIYLTSMNDFTAVNDVYKQFITADFPGRTCVEVCRLPKDAHVEIEMIASI